MLILQWSCRPTVVGMSAAGRTRETGHGAHRTQGTQETEAMDTEHRDTGQDRGNTGHRDTGTQDKGDTEHGTQIEDTGHTACGEHGKQHREHRTEDPGNTEHRDRQERDSRGHQTRTVLLETEPG